MISPSRESSLRRVAGNDRCVDCNKVFPQWASVTFGVLLCLSCAGVHRSLGVHTSFVKSLTMDTWSSKDIALLEAGGNGKWNTVCLAAGIFELNAAEKYTSRVAMAYRKRMNMVANIPFSALNVLQDLEIPAPESLDVLNIPTTGRSSPVRRSSLASLDATNAYSGPPLRAMSEPLFHRNSLLPVRSPTSSALEIKCTLCEGIVQLANLDLHSQQCQAPMNADMEDIEFDAVLGNGTNANQPPPLGLSLSKDEDGDTIVSKIISGGDADIAGVMVGARVVGLNHVVMSKFDVIMQSLNVPRPITFRFRLRQRFTAYEVVVETQELGCTFQTSLYKQVIVSAVEPGASGDIAGIRVGSRVVLVNGESYQVASDLLRALLQAPRPLTLRLHRYDGVR
ncbi:hypothetical protein THRCLA_05513 [Thraustotheca clavata]|uniref:ADP-ribosylation factor GTPase-activating protein n=1 Tax=Thraustotheca clavata TaxID=74557 RepID=A0A1V9ZVP0_9STRA|nr:hypothetical protein THRCLA_05513 [Thraustotheca clavata]